MNTVIAFSLLFAVASAQFQQLPQTRATPYPLLSRTEVRDDAGQFALSYNIADGTIVNEQGTLRPVAEGVQVLVKQGSFAYVTPEGIPIQLKYVADENGFRPEGNHLPVSVQPSQIPFV